MIQRIGKVAYKLELPLDSQSHPIFFVSCLKKRIGEAMEPQLELPPAQGDGCLQLETIAILDRRMVKRYNRPATQMLVHSSNSFPEDATWEDLYKLQQCFQTSSLKDKALMNNG